MPPLSTGRNGEPTTVEPDSGVQGGPALKRRYFRLPVMSRVSIQSKLLVMLLITSVLSAAVVGYIGYSSGRASLQASVFDRMTEIRQSQTRQLQSKFADLTNSLVVYSRGDAARQAIDAFTAGFNQLQNSTIDPAQQQSIENYYNNVFAKVEDAQTGNTVDVEGLLPTSNAQRYLQANYTAPFAGFGRRRCETTMRTTAARGRRPMPGSTISSVGSSPASVSRTRC